ncbi:MAG: hypothetical protein HY901_34260, partial [Deltaproteobacteria bacterium]|nr:hypothetical protein [Deltaproteobacteria bacterium]
VFALGVVAHEMLTGERLFRRDNDAAIVEALLREPIPDPRLKRPDIPERFAAVVMRALERDPDRRFQSADEMRQGLDAFLSERAWVPTIARLSAFLTDLFGAQDARAVLAGPAPEPTTTFTQEPPPLELPAPVRGIQAVRLFTEARRRGTRQLVRVVGEVPAALLKASQELVAVPMHVVQFAQRWTRKRLVTAALVLLLGGFAVGTGLREIREAAGVAVTDPFTATLMPLATSAQDEPDDDPFFRLLGQTLVPRALPPPPPRRAAPPHRPLRAAREASLARGYGKLVLPVRGTVFLYGERLGDAPLSRNLPPGSYDVTLLDPSGTYHTWIAVVRSGHVTRLSP